MRAFAIESGDKFMLSRLTLITLVLLAVPGTVLSRPSCPPRGYDTPALAQLKQNGWRIDDAAERAAFARAIVACLASPNPELRDATAYEALFTLLRGKELDAATMNALYADLKAMVEGPAGKGFARPFAALALAEIARADRIDPYLAPERRAELLGLGVAFMRSVDDYRGFSEKDGWRHGVAHGADLLLQLALNPAYGKADLVLIRDAVAAKVAPEGHSYVFGESERLARPVLYAARRGLLSEDEWTVWLQDLAKFQYDPFSGAAGLARRHNVIAFLSALYVNESLGENPADDVLRPGLESALRAIP